MTEEIVSLAEGARRYHLSYGALMGAILKGRLPCIRVGKKRFVKDEDIVTYLKSRFDQKYFRVEGEKVFDMEKGEMMASHAALMMGWHICTIYNKLYSGEIKAFKRGKFWVIPVQELRRLDEEKRKKKNGAQQEFPLEIPLGV